jgi:steroid 5-alpha reductase family enzyme
LTLACALAAMTTSQPKRLGIFALVGSLVWAAGFALEIRADHEKTRFRSDPNNRGRFIESGVWAWSRHPNYFGEITLWLGVALIAFPVSQGWQLATLISPIFVFVLLTRISGIPLLEARARKRWGDDPAFREYCERTPALVPRPPRSG